MSLNLSTVNITGLQIKDNFLIKQAYTIKPEVPCAELPVLFFSIPSCTKCIKQGSLLPEATSLMMHRLAYANPRAD